ncbi:c-type cytochrome biogenesis protein CcmI [Candidatus Halobeggiatoa sp. HSG11]|nr:c-type cytochrome biogenesis protein CcmI [Candidatus Halobeggiatoa sp. HSG11]
MIFWLIVSGLTLLALAFVVPPLLRTGSMAKEDRNSQNVAIYKERLAELEQENMHPDQLAAAKRELEKNLAQDLEIDTTTEVGFSRAKWASFIVTLLVPFIAIGGYWHIGSSHLLGEQPEVKVENPQKTDMTEMVEKLAKRLQEQPDDIKGWRMLARSYAFMERYDDAVNVYDKLLILVGNQDAELLTDFAQILALQNDGLLAGKATELLKSALKIDPKNQKGLWLSGFAASERGDLKLATDYWQQLLNQLPADDKQTRPMLETYLTEVQQKLEQIPTSKSVKPVVKEPIVEEPVKTPYLGIEVSVSLEASLQSMVNNDDVVFVFARATTGKAMPLAAVKKTVHDLPFKVVLDDSMAAMPTMKLSSAEEVTIVARISSSGSATAKSGDLQGEISPIKVGDKVEIVIEQVVP